MKRWLVIALVVTALVVLISPGIVGRLAERNLQQNIERIDAESPQVSVETESFERGWFSSEGRHRVTLSRVASTANADEMPSLIIETRFDHGIIPFTSMSRAGGSLEPGMVRALSTFQVETPDGELIDLPGQAYTEIGLGGETGVHYRLEEGSQQIEGQLIQWSGAEIFTQFDAHGYVASIRAKIKPMEITADDGSASIGAIEITADQQMTDYGFAVGQGEVRTGAMHFTDQNGVAGGFEEMVLQGETNLKGELVNGGYNMNLLGLSAPLFGEVDIRVAFSVHDLDAESVGNIVKIVNNAQTSDDPAQAMAEIYPLIEKDIETLVSAGGSISFDQLDITLPQGQVSSIITLNIDKSTADNSFSWATVALLTTASADISIPAMLIDMAALMSPDAESFINSGLLIQNGDAYEMRAEYAQGLLTINGAPFPIPLSGF